MIKDSKEAFKEEDLIPTQDMKCARCGNSDFEIGTPHNSGRPPHATTDAWIRLFMCKHCHVESAL